jgi:hypothetical protein
MLSYQEYNTALQIEADPEMFKYAMKTDVGNAFVYGNLECVDPVSYPEISGQYSHIKKVREEYTRHTRVVSTGKTSTVQVYYTWDEVSSENRYCSKIKFLGVEFNYGKIDFPGPSYITTVEDPWDSDVRFVYYGAPIKCVGTLYGDLRNNTINNGSFHANCSIESVLASYKSGGELVLFWFGWIILTGVLIFAFIYLDNHWLEDRTTHYRKKNYR